ncbi:hypothetical protein M422DRAFT_258121 [Sphaerobolus stellatus SS14]|uniref:Uncharacterized protein n=1 Tax=Sphaerobolus stellatus (strain SS14) TaxID=990650 RepID=A0A0C9UWI9_SPHS4|nr:hypothetical protein M422DRAFT_258121 [Sphaerobolus stellatus SS14]
MPAQFDALPYVAVDGAWTQHRLLRTIKDRRGRCRGTSSSVTMTSRAYHWLTALVAVLPDALLLLFLVLVPVVTGRPHKKTLSNPTLHAKSIHRTAAPTPRRAAHWQPAKFSLARIARHDTLLTLHNFSNGFMYLSRY